MLFFRSEERVREWCEKQHTPMRPLVTIAQLWGLAEAWYATRLQPDSRRPQPDEMRAIFARLGLAGEFWDPQSDSFGARRATVVMLCRNRVADFARWRDVFDSHAKAHRAAGLRLRDLWRDTTDPSTVYFLFEVMDLEKAQAFISDPAAAEAGKASGVLDGEYHFLETAPGY